jgi:hypothetical protein
MTTKQRSTPRISIAIGSVVLLLAALATGVWVLPRSTTPQTDVEDSAALDNATNDGQWSGAWGMLTLTPDDGWSVQSGDVWQALQQREGLSALIELSYEDLETARTNPGVATTIAGTPAAEYTATETYLDGAIEKQRVSVVTEAVRQGNLLRAALIIESTSSASPVVTELTKQYREILTSAIVKN